MPLNKSTGNMYSFITHTWNTVKGECPHGCNMRFTKKEREEIRSMFCVRYTYCGNALLGRGYVTHLINHG